MDCREWLKERLCGFEEHLCEEIRADAKKAGFNRRELKNARNSIGVKTFHQFDEDGATSNWFWFLEREK